MWSPWRCWRSVECRTGQSFAHGVGPLAHTNHLGPVATLARRVGVRELRLHPTVTGRLPNAVPGGTHSRPRWAGRTSNRDKLEVWLPLHRPTPELGCHGTGRGGYLGESQTRPQRVLWCPSTLPRVLQEELLVVNVQRVVEALCERELEPGWKAQAGPMES